MSDTTDSVTLYARTLQLVRERPRRVRLADLAEASGVSIAWVSRFQNELLPDPGVHAVQRLHDYLANVGNDAA